MISQNFEIFNAKKTVNGLEQPITQTQGYIDIYNQKVKLKNGIEFELNPEFYALNQINRNQDVWVLRLDFYNWFEVDQNKSKAPKKQRIPVFVRKEKDEWISQVDNQSLHRHKIVLKNTKKKFICCLAISNSTGKGVGKIFLYETAKYLSTLKDENNRKVKLLKKEKTNTYLGVRHDRNSKTGKLYIYPK